VGLVAGSAFVAMGTIILWPMRGRRAAVIAGVTVAAMMAGCSAGGAGQAQGPGALYRLARQFKPVGGRPVLVGVGPRGGTAYFGVIHPWQMGGGPGRPTVYLWAYDDANGEEWCWVTEGNGENSDCGDSAPGGPLGGFGDMVSVRTNPLWLRLPGRGYVLWEAEGLVTARAARVIIDYQGRAYSCGQQNKKLQYAVLAAAAVHGGTEPDLLDEVVWWQTDDFWEYALFAAAAYIRAAASRAGAPIRQACEELARRPVDPAT
jgi:hypothetical protein